ncbi:hypothetical protein J2S74_000457 [Evansella vedderi]|uniref:Uncharacterized protein n=1 Tax=Evansella vedderi TaxID=38282 RepID=A0ABT9ZQ56_9BACI|nr:hypothetical protein [Evansella vedderi]MDQ0253085.1 hypothetical protein [Evansella vedderi]
MSEKQTIPRSFFFRFRFEFPGNWLIYRYWVIIYRLEGLISRIVAIIYRNPPIIYRTRIIIICKHRNYLQFPFTEYRILETPKDDTS